MAAERPSSRGQAWFCTTGLPSDVVMEVEDMTFHLHKFPLMSKSRKLYQLITEQETNQTYAAERGGGEGEEHEPDRDEIEEVHCQISLQDFPGGSETFEMAARFCYGVKVDITSSTVAPFVAPESFSR
ncbi:hypothetical protein GH714_013246 [Hevea brasiliensis]|uniref:BTB domain-containing protein n=1 Tax=Hevea brasiliensis TaxID=3981 RepID=A0A6A6K643_HEVBR|nr:hypothetical protein GH714_013246 [Hevea brasiliensis]